jgi:ribosomal protein S18 acetylase RimI-like enzyme
MADAERVHEALRTMFENICGLFDNARFERREWYDLMLFPPVPIAQFNGVWPRDDAAAPALAEAVARIEELGLPCSVQLRRNLTPRCAAEAKRLGLAAEDSLPAMVVREDGLDARAVDGLTLTRVEDADARHEALAVAAAGFGAPVELLAPMYTDEVAAVDGFSYYVGRVNGDPVSTSAGYHLGDTVGIFNVATPPAHRGRGFGAALTAEAAREGFADGAELAWLQSSPMGRSVYGGLGFREVETYVLMKR